MNIFRSIFEIGKAYSDKRLFEDEDKKHMENIQASLLTERGITKALNKQLAEVSNFLRKSQRSKRRVKAVELEVHQSAAIFVMSEAKKLNLRVTPCIEPNHFIIEKVVRYI